MTSERFLGEAVMERVLMRDSVYWRVSGGYFAVGHL
jgi:hypothetical protein